MAIFDDSVPANTESVKNGASRIRSVKTMLNTMLGFLFNDDGATFKSGWVKTSHLDTTGGSEAVATAAIQAEAVTDVKLAQDASSDALRAVSTDSIKDQAVTNPKIAPNAVQADRLEATVGRAGKMLRTNDAGSAVEWDDVPFVPRIAGHATSTTWVCPVGITRVRLRLWGAGGGGGGGTGTTGRGGGAGGFSEAAVTVVPGTTYDIVIGAAGTAGTPGGAGGDGGDTYFVQNGLGAGSALLTAGGGGGGDAGAGSVGSGGTSEGVWPLAGSDGSGTSGGSAKLPVDSRSDGGDGGPASSAGDVGEAGYLILEY